MSEIKTLLPHTANDFSRELEIVTAERIEGIENPLHDLWNVDTCPEHLLPWLAWAFSVEVWEHAWSEEIKRNVIRDAIAVHRIKGTRRSVELALEALNMRIDLREGFELDEHGDRYGPAHTFKLDAFADDIFDAGFQIDARLHAIVTELIRNVKPVHVHFTLRVGEKFDGHIHVRSGARVHARHTQSHLAEPRPASTHATSRLRAGSRHQARWSQAGIATKRLPMTLLSDGYSVFKSEDRHPRKLMWNLSELPDFRIEFFAPQPRVGLLSFNVDVVHRGAVNGPVGFAFRAKHSVAESQMALDQALAEYISNAYAADNVADQADHYGTATLASLPVAIEPGWNRFSLWGTAHSDLASGRDGLLELNSTPEGGTDWNYCALTVLPIGAVIHRQGGAIA